MSSVITDAEAQNIYANLLFDIDPKYHDRIGIYTNVTGTCSKHHKMRTICDFCCWNKCQGGCGATKKSGFGGWTWLCSGCSARSLPVIPDHWKNFADTPDDASSTGAASAGPALSFLAPSTAGTASAGPALSFLAPSPAGAALSSTVIPAVIVDISEDVKVEDVPKEEDMLESSETEIFLNGKEIKDPEKVHNVFERIQTLRENGTKFAKAPCNGGQATYFTVKSITEVINKEQEEKFKLCEKLSRLRNNKRPDHLKVEDSRMVSEVVHGTSRSSAFQINKDGLKATRTTVHVYGKGTYFGDGNLFFPVDYALRSPEPTLIIGKAVVGRSSFISDQDQDTPNEGDDSGSNGSRFILIIFGSDQFLAELIVLIEKATQKEWDNQREEVRSVYRQWTKSPKKTADVEKPDSKADPTAESSDDMVGGSSLIGGSSASTGAPSSSLIGGSSVSIGAPPVSKIPQVKIPFSSTVWNQLVTKQPVAVAQSHQARKRVAPIGAVATGTQGAAMVGAPSAAAIAGAIGPVSGAIGPVSGAMGPAAGAIGPVAGGGFPAIQPDPKGPPAPKKRNWGPRPVKPIFFGPQPKPVDPPNVDDNTPKKRNRACKSKPMVYSPIPILTVPREDDDKYKASPPGSPVTPKDEDDVDWDPSKK